MLKIDKPKINSVVTTRFIISSATCGIENINLKSQIKTEIDRLFDRVLRLENGLIYEEKV